MWISRDRYDELVKAHDDAVMELSRAEESNAFLLLAQKDWARIAVDTKKEFEAEQKINKITEQACRSCESALGKREKQVDSLNEQVANLVTKTKRHKEEIEQERRLRNQANNRAEDAENALADAKRVSFIVTAHRNNAAAAKRYDSLDDAVAEYSRLYESKVADSTDTPAGFSLHIYALVGDLVVSDVTDPAKWGETLPVSTERSKGGKMSLGSDLYTPAITTYPTMLQRHCGL